MPGPLRSFVSSRSPSLNVSDLHDTRRRERVSGGLSGKLLVDLLNSQLIDEPVQIAPSDSEGARAFRLPPSAVLKRAKNKPALERANLCFISGRELRCLAIAAHNGGQLPDFHGRAFRQNHGALHGVG